ncbi:MAG: glycerol-3-phosphate dehydrogenase/oxidase [Gammaproteobacteria bacterium]|nr:glycerol-3-phosphate dehydrogenase/oxidase [Gammaproteobacteria bacterium]
MSTLGNRADIWRSLGEATTPHDMIIVGGGITGAGILREAARQGLKALLVEQKDFAWGTSSRSSKMVHGGLRYIAQGDIALTRHSALERERLIREAPGLVERMGYLFPIRKGQFPGRLLFGILLGLYDILAGVRTRAWLDARSVLQKAPGLRSEGLKGASYYTDAITDDARLVLRVLQQAAKEGGVALNYVAAQGLLRNASGRVDGLTLRNEIDGETLDLRARVVVNATGAWVDELREAVAHERTIRRLRGSHLLVSAQRLAVAEALTLFHPADRRATFIFPWEGFTVIGTTDLDHDASLEHEPAISRQEVDYLLQLVRREFPGSGIGEADILSTWAGVRPVISKDRSKDPSREKRDHKVWVDQGLISVSGGKLTTFRLIARDTLSAAKPFLQGQAMSNTEEWVLEPACIALSSLAVPDRDWALRMIGRYGDEAGNLLEQCAAGERERIAGTAFCLAEMRWSCRNEQVVHLDDLLLRRTRLGLLCRDGGEAIIPAVRSICQQELLWSDAQWQEELRRYREIWRQSYSLPGA